MITLLSASPWRDLYHVGEGMAFMFTAILFTALYQQRKKNNITRMLFWIFGGLLLLYIKEALYKRTYYDASDSIESIISSIDIWIVPVLMAFNMRLVNPKTITNKLTLFMFLPFFLHTILHVFFNSEKFFIDFMLFVWLFISVCTCLIFIAADRYNRYVIDNFSNKKNLTVSWVRLTTILYFFLFIFWTVMEYAGGWILSFVYELCYITIWSFIYYYSIHHKVVETIPNTFLQISRENGNSKSEQYAIEPHSASIMSRIYSCFELEKPFLNPELSINDLAGTINSNRTYVSNAINKEANKTFYQFVNYYRILHAVGLMKLNIHKKYTIETIAKESGFNSMATFYSFFKQENGCNPKEFIKKIEYQE